MSRGHQISSSAMRDVVKRTIGESCYDSILHYLEHNRPAMWGTEQPRRYLRQCVDCMFYHDIEGIGYAAIEQKLSDNKIIHNTMLHNAHIIRKTLQL